MSADDLMIAIIISGIGLTVAYLRAEFVSWRRFNAAERKKKAGLRELHILAPAGLPPTKSADTIATSETRERRWRPEAAPSQRRTANA